MKFLENHRLSDHPSQAIEHPIIGVFSDGLASTPSVFSVTNSAQSETLETLSKAGSILHISKPYKLASREFHPENSVIEVPARCVAERVVRIGGKEVVMMAGPCTVESEKQLMSSVEAVRKEGAVILRGGFQAIHLAL